MRKIALTSGVVFVRIQMVPHGTGRCHKTVGGYPPFLQGGDPSCPLSLQRKGVVDLITYDELFQFCLVLIGFAGLIVQIAKKK